MQRWAAAAGIEKGTPNAEELDQWTLHSVNDEYARSKVGGYKRLFPSARSAEYLRFLAPERRRLNQLPFDVDSSELPF